MMQSSTSDLTDSKCEEHLCFKASSKEQAVEQAAAQVRSDSNLKLAVIMG